MFKTVHEAVVHVKELRALVKDVRGVDIVVAPPATALHAAAEAARNSNIAVAGQNCHWEREGAFTGEVSAGMVREAGAEYVVLGHSERRTLFGDTDRAVNLKMRAALAAGSGADRVRGRVARPARREPDARGRGPAAAARARRRRRAEQVAALVVAYEPVWAIGTGRNATPEQAGEVHAHIRLRLRSWFGADAAERCRVIYGGSVKPGNIARPAGAARRGRRARRAGPAWMWAISGRSWPPAAAPRRPHLTGAVAP